MSSDGKQHRLPARYRAGFSIPALGYVALILLALWGSFLIADYPGPPGRFGWAEIPGWWTLCLLAGIAQFQVAWRFPGAPGSVAGLILPAVLGFATYLDIQPSTAPAIKDAVEYVLQGIGLLSIGPALIAFLWVVIRWGRR